MSYCEIVLFNDGKPFDSIEYRNSWGGAAYVWESLYNEYLKDELYEFDNWLLGLDRYGQYFWDLSLNPTLPLFMRVVHMSQFDRAIIKRENFGQFAQHLTEFVQHFGSGKRVCHLIEWAKQIEKSDCDAIGFYPTSVSENLWWRYDEDKDEEVAYDYNSTSDQHWYGNAHFFVYDRVVSKTREQAQPIEKKRKTFGAY